MKTNEAKILKADFLEPVLVPGGAKGVGEFVEKYRHSASGVLSLRAQGPGLVLELVDGGRQATIIPWTNVRSVVVELPAPEEKTK